MRVIVLGLTLALCACGREPSFDERYSKAEKEIEEQARELDEQLNDADTNGASNRESEVQLE